MKTEMSYWLDGDFEGHDIFIIGFSSQKIYFKPSKLKFLNGLGYAIYVAAFDLDEDDSNKESSPIPTDLDNKEFVPRPTTTPYSSVANFHGTEGMPSILSASSLASSPKRAESHGGSESVGLVIESEVEARESALSFLASEPSALINDPFSPARQRTESDYFGLPLGRSSDMGDSMAYGAHAWMPSDSFAFPVASIPVRNWVPDNLTMEHFKEIKHVADGSNAHIYLASFEGLKVIVKMIKDAAQFDSIAVHEFEVEHGLLIRIHHPNIIKLLGAGRLPRRFIVLEYLGGGTLNTILSANQQTGIASKIFRRPTFTYANLLSKLKDVADALDYLHSKCYDTATIIHRGNTIRLFIALLRCACLYIDLKPDNVGFTSEGVLKLFDFGLCTCVRRREIDTEVYEMTGNTGSLRYMAPEVALRKPYNEKVDVYSFGIMAWQMARDKVPFKAMNKDDFMRMVVLGGDRPQVDKAWPDGFINLLSSCWNSDPNARPSFSEIVSELTRLFDDLGGKAWPKKGRVFSPRNSSRTPPQSTWF